MSSRRRGYTLIELLIVVAVLGLAGAILVPHLVNQDDMTAQAAVRRLIADLSFAQSDALAHQEYRRVYFYDDGSGYCLFRVDESNFGSAFDPDTADYISDPLTGGDRYIVNYTTDERFTGVTISAVELDGGERSLVYDELGGTVRPGGLPGSGGTIVITFDDENYQITVSPFTGKLTVAKL